MATSIKHPLVSVVMSVYNGEEYLREALNSILSQSFKDFECVIINDGSTDRTAEILKSYKDSRLIILEQENQGLVPSLNRGIKTAHGKYIARHDADDRSEPDRFEAQVKYLEMLPEVVLVGSSISVMNSSGVITHKHNVLLNDPELRQELMVRSPFAHGSVMFRRRSALKVGLYDRTYWPAEDYEYWLRLSSVGKFANLDECLYIYREHEAGISARNAALQAEAVSAVQRIAWEERKRLVKHSISLNPYRTLTDGNERIGRIFSNINTVCVQASRRGNHLFALKNLKLIASSPTSYRKVAGSLKRKLKK